MAATPATALAVALGCLLGCATAHNYSDPAGPRHSGVAAVRPEPRPGIRVVTFNIKYGRQVARAIEALSRPPLAGADLIVLQEMDARGVASIAEALGMGYVYYPAAVPPRSGRDFGNAILSPWPIEAGKKIVLPHLSRIVHEARAAVRATVRVGDRPLRVYSVHLGSPLGISGRKRREQAQAVVADADDSLHPVVVAGDFNSKGIGTQFVAAGYAWPTERVGRTTALFSFDHIFTRGLCPFGEVGAGVSREGPKASDHLPVWADLTASCPVAPELPGDAEAQSPDATGG